jgi:MoaA/NifB/PqqE/SkfB family radical SAM enzyme
MRCIHCGSSAGYERKSELLTTEWKNVVKDLSDINCKSITLLGGEPFLRKDWYEISKEIRNRGIALTIISNGLLIDSKIISKIRTLEPKTVAISLDGASANIHDAIRRVAGSFAKCKKCLMMLLEAEIPTSVVTTLTKVNLKDLPNMRDFLLNRGIAWQIQIGVPMGRFPFNYLISKEEFYAAALFIATSRTMYTFKELPITGAHCFGYHSKKLPNISLNIAIGKG